MDLHRPLFSKNLRPAHRKPNRKYASTVSHFQPYRSPCVCATPTATEGLPAASVGDSLALQVTVTADTETQVTGLAQATVQRAGFELTIPQVEGVADVTEEVHLELEFVAIANE